MWTVGEPGSSSEPSSSLLSLGDRGSSSSSFSDPFGPSSDPFELEARQVTRKRKAVELTIGQSSSGVGSSTMFQGSEGGPPADPTIPRLGLSIGEHPVVENTRRNVGLRINSARQQVDALPANNANRESDVSVLRLNTPAESSLTHQGQPVLRVPALRRNFQSTSRWRASRSANVAMSGARNEVDSISDHPLFTPPSNATTPSQTELNWSSNSGGNGPSSGSSTSHHSRRLSAFLRRSLLPVADPEDGVGQNGNIFPRVPPALSGSSSSSQDVGVPPGQHNQPLSRSSLLLGRQLEGVFAFPHHSRTATPNSEGRGRLVSEIRQIRNVLDLMRRGEPLRFEDLMILDQSVFYGVADIHDRHRDMRLDIDNMSYEELLALEERIGNVNTGLTEETILKHIRQKQYVVGNGSARCRPCCICQEEYKDGDDLGTLDCTHDFHYGCIKQWLQQKNLCPTCKSTGFAST
uniref:RING-type E3 ubiquitin transferase n=1 Tax=Zinnia elegans TaxID=34245 RepID=A0ZVZ9_ZINEL|nr:RING-finger domain protein [Zinnia elegans]